MHFLTQRTFVFEPVIWLCFAPLKALPLPAAVTGMPGRYAMGERSPMRHRGDAASRAMR